MKPLKPKPTITQLGNSLNQPEFFSRPSFWMPELMISSAWIAHAPFAFWLTEALQPKTLVELGTHRGYSYFAFCQAVQRLELDTRCYAIDNWEGDEHAGFYGKEVFDKLKDYNDSRYSSFSRLIRSSFDEALEGFQDESIDLLHIDGRHFYEDIKSDFENWLPKLSNRSVVILHDTNVMERNFGVHKYWEELASHHPHFEFLHGNGLGVLGTGKFLPPIINSLFTAFQDYEQTCFIRELYSRLGASLVDRFALSQQNKRIEHLQERLGINKDRIQRLEEKLNQKTERAKRLKVKLAQRIDMIQKLEAKTKKSTPVTPIRKNT